MAKNRTIPKGGSSSRQLGALIERLGPINNTCRNAEGIDKVESLWDLGDAILRFDPNAKDELLWAVSERSYLTRDLLRYALIIRRNWIDRADLRRTFEHLTHYSLFREALPFLKGDRCGISTSVYEDILARLSRGNPQETKEFLLTLKGKKIGRKHKKGLAVTKMSEVAATVRTAIRELVDLAKTDQTRITALRNSLGSDAILSLSQWCMALADDGLAPVTQLYPSTWPEPCATLCNSLVVVGQANRDDRAGFRKALGSIALMEAADLINALRSDERLEQWKRRRVIDLML